MYISAQVVGQANHANGMLFRVKERLSLMNIAVAWPQENRLSLRDHSTLPYNPAQWTPRSATQDLYDHMQTSKFLVVSNDIGGILDLAMTNAILHAMQLGQPVIIAYKPYFMAEVPAELRKIVTAHLDQVFIRSLLKFNNPELQDFIKDILKTKPAYNLTKKETALIASAQQAYLASLQ